MAIHTVHSIRCDFCMKISTFGYTEQETKARVIKAAIKRGWEYEKYSEISKCPHCIEKESKPKRGRRKKNVVR